MRANRISIIRRTTYDFGALAPAGSQTLVLRRSIPANYSRGTLMVRVHALSVGAGDGQVIVSVRADGFTRDDPAQFFFGQTLAAVIAAADGDAAPRYLVEVFPVAADHLVVQLEGAQDKINALALSVRLSVDLLLDDGPLPEEDPWTPAELAPEGWWRADLGHVLADQDPVPSWANQGTAGSAGDVAQSNATYQPTYVESEAAFDDQAVMDFDGDQNLFATAGTWWNVPDGDDFSLVVVARPRSASGTEIVLTTRNAGTLGGLQARFHTSGPCDSRIWDTGAADTLDANCGTATQNAVQVLAAALTGAVSPGTDSLTSLLDGTAGTADTGDLGAIAPSSTRELVVAGSGTTLGTFDGQIAEILFLKRLLTAEEDAALTEYLNERYGLALSGVTQ